MRADDVILGALDAFNSADRAAWEASLTHDCAYWEPCSNRHVEGRTEVTDLVFMWRTSWPDLRHTETRTITGGGPDGDVAVETVWLGTQTGPLHTPDGQTFPATDKQTVNPAAIIATVRDGRVASIHHYFDLANLMRLLGLVE